MLETDPLSTLLFAVSHPEQHFRTDSPPRQALADASQSHGSRGGRGRCFAARAAPGNASRCLRHLVKRLQAGLRFLHFLPAPASKETKSPKPGLRFLI